MAYLASTFCFRCFHDFISTFDEVLNKPVGYPRLCVDQCHTQMNAIQQSNQQLLAKIPITTYETIILTKQ